jgi:hypothetical protein
MVFRDLAAVMRRHIARWLTATTTAHRNEPSHASGVLAGHHARRGVVGGLTSPWSLPQPPTIKEEGEWGGAGAEVGVPGGSGALEAVLRVGGGLRAARLLERPGGGAGGERAAATALLRQGVAVEVASGWCGEGCGRRCAASWRAFPSPLVRRPTGAWSGCRHPPQSTPRPPHLDEEGWERAGRGTRLGGSGARRSPPSCASAGPRAAGARRPAPVDHTVGVRGVGGHRQS